jgi:hypothetical protein
VNAFAETEAAIRGVELVCSFGAALSSAEWLCNARHVRDESLLGWPVSQLRHRALTDGLLARVVDPLFHYPAVMGLFALRLAAAVGLIAALAGGSGRAALTLVVAVTTAAIALRSPFGLDGSDQMAAFVFGTLALARLVPTPAVESAFLAVVALQACLAYFTAGAAKLSSPIWRSGTAIPGITSTRMYGSLAAAALVRDRPWLWLTLAWSVILTECAFPLAVVSPMPVTLTLLAGGIAFHLMSGVVMGLNTFIWSFLSTYPAILWCHARLYGA